MTRAEAIERLNCLNNKCDPYECIDVKCYKCDEAVEMAIKALEQEPIIYCKDCKYWHEWENGTGSCHRSDIMWVGSDYDDYCSFAERKEQ